MSIEMTPNETEVLVPGQAAPAPTGHDLVSDGLLRARLEFAQQCFNNAQELNRSLDQKASFVIAAVTFLTLVLVSLAPQGLEVTPVPAWAWLKPLAALFTAVYMILVLGVLYYATRVFTARPHSLRPDTKAPGLIFPLILLERFQSEEGPDERLYLQTLSNASPSEILHDYAHQVMEISHIYRSKQEQINASIRLFPLTAALAVVAMLALLAVITLPHV